jgi:hypothetical protein
MINGLPVGQVHETTAGAGYDEDIAMPGMTSTSKLLYVISWDGSNVVGLNCSDFTPGTATMASSSVDTTGFRLFVGWNPATT